jgi:DNA-binding response OmpR family regulator
MSRLLLIDDDPALTELLGDYLHDQGYEVEMAHDGDEGLRAFFSTRPELVILDVTMPNRDGWQTLERIRELADTPVIMLTARDEEVFILRGFKLGADDYVTKPFSFAELAARVASVLKRHRSAGRGDAEEAAAGILRQGDLMVDLVAKRVWRGEELLHLTPTEFKLLTALMRRPGEVLLPQELVREVWGEAYLSDVGYVRRYIWHLRKKIEPDPNQPRYIYNEHGFGYRFQAAGSDIEPRSSQT